MDVKAKRKLKEVIRGLIGDGFIGTQADLSKALKTRGINVTQSTISRTIGQMGISKSFSAGKATYKIQTDSKFSYRGSLADLIIKISSNDSIVVIRTRPGSAMFVAGFLDHECKESVLGTVAGDDTIFVAPVKGLRLSALIREISAVLTEL